MKRNRTLGIAMVILLGTTISVSALAQKIQLSKIEVSAAIGSLVPESIILNGGLDLYEVNNWAIGGNVLMYNYPSTNHPSDYVLSNHLFSSNKYSYSDEIFTFSLNVTKKIPVCKYFQVGLSLGIAENQFTNHIFSSDTDSQEGIYVYPNKRYLGSNRTYFLGFLAQTKFMVPLNSHSSLGIAIISNQNPKNSYNAFTFSFNKSFNIKSIFSKKRIKA